MNLLIANRGEIAVRIARAAAELGARTVAVYSQDDAESLHIRRAEHAVELPGTGPRAYLDGAAIIAAALQAGCDAIHPGYGFLSESAAFARDCAEAGLRFVGPSVEHLELFGDKGKARSLAQTAWRAGAARYVQRHDARGRALLSDFARCTRPDADQGKRRRRRARHAIRCRRRRPG